MTADASDPAYSIVSNQLLVAYIWPASDGFLRRAGRAGTEPICRLGYAEVHCFSAAEEGRLKTVAERSSEMDVLIFELGFEGFEVVPGRFKPNQSVRRF